MFEPDCLFFSRLEPRLAFLEPRFLSAAVYDLKSSLVKPLNLTFESELFLFLALSPFFRLLEAIADN